ncbi:transposase family protein [Streptomyces sp. NPDC088766]|uniref:transposase family protein n=1 Tax=Streptomyces sp. NPDC088766 TaxID=3365893 RepID=UPI00381B1E65
MGAGAKHRPVFVDRPSATLTPPRHGVPHAVPACWFGVDRSTLTRTIGEVRPLRAERGRTVTTDVRLRSPAEVVDRPGASGTTGIVDGTEIRGGRPVPETLRTPPAPAGRGWSGFWPTGLRPGTPLMPATEEWVPGPVAGR